MAGSKQRKSSGFFSVWSFLKPKRNRGCHDAYEDGCSARRIWPSDEDRGSWGVAEPNIDRMAQAFIENHYKKTAMESELHFHA